MANGQKSTDKRALILIAGMAAAALVLAVCALVLSWNGPGGPPSAVKTGSPQHTPFEAKTREEVRDFVAEEVERQAGRSLHGFAIYSSGVLAAVSLLIVVALAVLGFNWWRQSREYDRLMVEARRCHDEVTRAAEEAANWKSQAEDHLRTVRESREQAQEAVEEIRGLLEETKESASTTKSDRHLTQGLTYQNQGDWDRAIDEYTLAIEAKPSAAAYNNRGLAWADKDEHDKAIEDFDRAIDLDPKTPAYYYNRGVVWAKKGEYDNAIENFDWAIAGDPKELVFYSVRGVARAAKGEYQKAVEDCKRAIELKAIGLGFTNWAGVLILCGKYSEAIAKVDEAARRGLMTGEQEQLTGPHLKGVALALEGEPTADEESTLESRISRGLRVRRWSIGALDRYLAGLRPEDYPPGAVEAARRIHAKFKEAVD